MTQTRRDSHSMQVLGERLRELVDDHLGVPWDSLATQLGYANASTLRKARDGAALLSLEKLMRLAHVEAPDGRRACIDWLLTGEGEPLRRPNAQSREVGADAGGEAGKGRSALMRRIARATPDLQHKIEAFLEVQGA